MSFLILSVCHIEWMERRKIHSGFCVSPGLLDCIFISYYVSLPLHSSPTAQGFFSSVYQHLRCHPVSCFGQAIAPNSSILENIGYKNLIGPNHPPPPARKNVEDCEECQVSGAIFCYKDSFNCHMRVHFDEQKVTQKKHQPAMFPPGSFQPQHRRHSSMDGS